MGLGLSAAWRDWAERLDLAGTEWTLGSHPGCDVRVRHPSVAAEHAQVLLRRDRCLVRPAGAASVLVDDQPIRAPVALAPGQVFRLGDVDLRVDPQPGPPRAQIADVVGALVREWGARGGVRRFEAADGAELCWAESPPPRGPAWPVGGGFAWTFAVPPGVRLRSLLARLDGGAIALPGEVAVVVVAQLGAAVTAFHRAYGPHGSVGADAVALGLGGEVALVPPGPGAPPEEAFMSPERRFGAAPTRPDDAFAFASLGVRLLRVCGAPPAAWAPLTPLLQSDPRRRSVDVKGASAALRARAEAHGLDATARHVARPVKLLAAERAAPLLSTRA